MESLPLFWSLPMGLYAVTTDHFGEPVEVCPEGNAAKESKTRGYRNTRSCPDGGEPLIKPVIAREGDVVQFSERGISTCGKLCKNTAPLTLAGLGRLLTPWKFGIYRVARGQVWVASTHNHGSCDNRYFGPIPVSSIRTRLRLLPF
jgi:conjugative transfer signal peptidase TraF